VSSNLPVVADESAALRSAARLRRLVVTLCVVIVVLGPGVHPAKGQSAALRWTEFGLAVTLAVLAAWAFNWNWQTSGTRRLAPPLPALLLALGLALFVLGGVSWVGPLVVAGAICGRFSNQARLVLATAAACVVAGVSVAIAHHYTAGDVISAVVVAPLVTFLAYSLGRRADTLDSLRRTRAELARAAVAEERLRIARDLHDLLGHSLSLITLKAELAGKLMTADPDGAATQIAELESVARQSLSDVREAVAGFRQPDLAGELAAARQLLDAAGVSSQITAADISGLAAPVDAVLAWAVREGTTNVVRHSRATHVSIRISRHQDNVSAEVTDNGPLGLPDDQGYAAPGQQPTTAGPAGRAVAVRPRFALGGSGLAGLTERVRSLGGELSAGFLQPQGFTLRVVVPLNAQQ
jgi:two-component system, NarL family, sensor histidine kinase DesK